MTITATTPAVLGQLEPNNGFGLPDLAIVKNMQDCLNGDQALNTITLTSAVIGGVGGTTLNAAMAASISQTANATAVGAVAAPVSGTTAVAISKVGNEVVLTFTMTAMRIAVTDAAASGSFGATKIFDFVEQALVFKGARANWTASVEGAGLSGADDAAYVIGVGTTPITVAADGVLAAANQNVAASKSITDPISSAQASVSAPAVATAAVDGTGTASDLYVNWSGTAATVDASSTIDMTGTLTIALTLLGDD